MTTSSVQTRSASVTELVNFVGSAKKLVESELPTLRDALRHGLFVRESRCSTQLIDKWHCSFDDISSEVATTILDIWLKANVAFQSPVIITERQLKRKLTDAYKLAKDIAWKRVSAKEKVRKAVENLDRLLDLTKCKCVILTCQQAGCVGCVNGAHSDCRCPKTQKIPPAELKFIASQRMKMGERGSMLMMHKDTAATRRHVARMARQDANRAREQTHVAGGSKAMSEQVRVEQIPEAMDEASSCEIESSVEQSVSDDSPVEPSTSTRNMLNIPHTALAAIRFNLSDYGTAAVASGYLHDLIQAGVVSKEMTFLAVDRMKVARAKSSLMDDLRKEATRVEGGLQCVLFDSRVDNTKTLDYDEETRTNHPRVEKENHYSLADEHGKYLTHFTHKKLGVKSSAEQVADIMVEWMKEHGVDQTLVALGADSTNSNTGGKGGTIPFIERKIGRKCAWLVCQLHTNELPLRHLIEKLGKSKEGNSS